MITTELIKEAAFVVLSGIVVTILAYYIVKFTIVGMFTYFGKTDKRKPFKSLNHE